MKPEINIYPGVLNNEAIYQIKFQYDKSIIALLKERKLARWSPELRCWYMRKDAVLYQMLVEALNPIATVNFEEGVKGIQHIPSIVESPRAHIKPDKEFEAQRMTLTSSKNLNERAKVDLEKWMHYLNAQRYSQNTLRVYHNAMLQFLVWLGDKPHREVRKEDVGNWMIELVNKQKCSLSYQNQQINAIRSFYKHIFSVHLSADMIERPRHEYKLPHYLTKDEAAKLLNCVRNTKHRCMLSLAYACGLRAGELVNIRISDIDASQRLLVIRGGKGKRDRVVPIPQRLLDILDGYGKSYQPIVYLFEGEKKGESYSMRSLQYVFKKALHDSGIKKDATLHWLRHSYATHLLEQGTNIKLIQQLLGHKNLKTTEIYMHISAISFQQVVSPFENLEAETGDIKLKAHKPTTWLKSPGS